MSKMSLRTAASSVRVRAILLLSVMIATSCSSPRHRQATEQKSPLWSLHDAALDGNVNGIRDALAAGADINGVTDKGQTALLLALGPHGSGDAAAYLISRGADVNLADNGGNTPLMTAAMWVSLPSVRLLLDRGARVNAQAADGVTAPMLVGNAGPESVAVLSLLLDRGADTRIRTKSGRDIFNSMASFSRKDLLDVLRARGVTE